MRLSGIAILVVTGLGSAAAAQDATAPAASAKLPLAADLKISDQMVTAPPAVDLDVKIKPNTKPVRLRHKGLSRDELCGTMNTQRVDMGRGMATASPQACRNKTPTGITVFGSKGL